MKINCFWEHNGNDTILYALDLIGAYARGESLPAAIAKMTDEIKSRFACFGVTSFASAILPSIQIFAIGTNASQGESISSFFAIR